MEMPNSLQNLNIVANGINISYNDEGRAEIPTIFIHGFPFDKSMWREQIDMLKSSGRAISYDLRGFGDTKDEKMDLSMDLFAEDLIAFMDELEIETAVICGLSMGGYICLNAISRFPERFKALILCDTQCIADSVEGKAKRYATIKEIKREGTDSFNEKFIESVFHPNALQMKNDVVDSLKKVVQANSVETITSGLKALAERSDTCSILSDINVPTLIICGREDALTPIEQSEFLHKSIDGSNLKIVEVAGHVSNLEQPIEFNKHLKDFLDLLVVAK